MNALPARPFLGALQQVDRELTLPVLRRVRILRELESDLDALCGRLIEGGMALRTARERSVEVLVPVGPALEELVRVHAPFCHRVRRRVGERHFRAVERIILALTAAGVLAVEASALRITDPTGPGAPVLALMFLAGAVLFVSILVVGYRLWIRGDASAPGSLAAVAVGSAACGVAGVVGVAIDLHRLFGLLESSPHLAGELIPRWIVRDSSLMAVALLGVLAGGLAWFVFTQWVAFVAHAHTRTLGAAPASLHTRSVIT